jgi:hypothetical protein
VVVQYHTLPVECILKWMKMILSTKVLIMMTLIISGMNSWSRSFMYTLFHWLFPLILACELIRQYLVYYIVAHKYTLIYIKYLLDNLWKLTLGLLMHCCWSKDVRKLNFEYCFTDVKYLPFFLSSWRWCMEIFLSCDWMSVFFWRRSFLSDIKCDQSDR